MYKKLLVILVFVYALSFTNICIAQVYSKEERQLKNEQKRAEKDAKELTKIQAEYIEILPKDRILIGFHLGGIENRYILRDNNNERFYHLSSNIVPSAGFHFKYKRLPLFSFSLPLNFFSENSNFITKGYSLGLHGQISRLLVIDAYFFKIDGLKLNKVDGAKILEGSVYHRSSTTNLSLESFIIFNNAKFSYKNAYLSGESQKKSSGSVILGISLSYLRQKNKDPLFNTQFTLDKTLNYKDLKAVSFASMLGYLHTFTIGKYWYLGGGLLYGPNLHYGRTEYFGVQKNNSFVRFSSSFKAKFSAGYHYKKTQLKFIGHTGFYGYKPNKKNAFNSYITDMKLSFTYTL